MDGRVSRTTVVEAGFSTDTRYVCSRLLGSLALCILRCYLGNPGARCIDCKGIGGKADDSCILLRLMILVVARVAEAAGVIAQNAKEKGICEGCMVGSACSSHLMKILNVSGAREGPESYVMEGCGNLESNEEDYSSQRIPTPHGVLQRESRGSSAPSPCVPRTSSDSLSPSAETCLAGASLRGPRMAERAVSASALAS